MFLSSVLEKESVDLKVLVIANIPNYEKEPLIAVKRDNLQHQKLLTKQFFNHKLLSYLKGSKNKVEKKPNFQRNHSSIKQTKVMSLPNNSKGGFFSEIAIRFSNLQKKYSKRLS